MDGPLATFDHACARTAGARVARLATTRADGRVDLVPITFALLADHRIVTAVDHKPKTTRQLHRLDRIRDRPAVSLLIDHYDDRDWSQLWWVRVTGDARVLDPDQGSVLEVAPLVDALVAKYPQYREVRPSGPVVEMTPTRWQWWSAADGSGRSPSPTGGAP